MATAILIGAGVTLAALAGRAAIRAAVKSGVGSMTPGTSKYIRGGFEPNMSSREAIQILGLKDGSSNDSIKKQHRTLLFANHPDKGGSPYLALKVNEAKALLLKK
jgi:DnaJ homolog subfamily C member 19